MGRWRDSTEEEEGGALWLEGGQWHFWERRCYGGDIARVDGWVVGMDPGSQLMNEKNTQFLHSRLS